MQSTAEAAHAATQLIEGLVAGEPDRVRSLFSARAEIDDPFAGRRIDGGFEAMVRDWRPVQGAEAKSVELEHCTSADGFVAAEMRLHLERDGSPLELPIVAVSELADDGRFAKTRLYYRRAHIDGRQHHRDRLLDAETDFAFHPTIARYQKALLEHDLEAFVASFADDGVLDGHGAALDFSEGLGMGRYEGKDAIRAAVSQIMKLIEPRGADSRLEHVNAFTDGTTTVLEFNILLPLESRVQAGVACYELGPDGLIKEARVYDEVA